MNKTKKERLKLRDLMRKEEQKPKIQYAIVLVDKAGSSVQLFHTKKLAEDYLEQIDRMKKQTKKAWAVLDVDGGMKYPSVSIFDTKREAKIEVDRLNRLPNPTDVKDPENHIVKIEIKIL